MRFEPTAIDGVVVVRLELHRDARGGFARTFDVEAMAAAGVPFIVNAANVSRNHKRHTLRGLHYQRDPHGEPKIVSCTRGRIWDVAVDMRPGSPTHRAWTALEMTPDGDAMFLLPAGVAHGFITLEDDSDVHYLMGAPYVPAAATGVRWDDPAIGIAWPAEPVVMSAADARHALLEVA